MNLKKFGIVLLLILSFLSLHKAYAQNSNTGFVPGNIWYSKDPLEEGDKIKIHTFVFNPDARELSGTVIFFDKTVLLGKKDFVITSGTAKDIYIDWMVTAGDHTIFGKIENAKFLISKGKYEEVYIAENETEKSSNTVSKKINSNSISTDLNSTPLSNIQKVIKEKTPSIISKTINSTTDALENLREGLSVASDKKKDEVKDELKSLELSEENMTISTADKKAVENALAKPLKNAELFFLTLWSFILSSKIIFYSILGLLIFLILRFIWNLIF